MAARISALILIGIAARLGAPALAAATTTPQPDRVAVAVPVEQAPILDGVLTEGAWSRAPAISGFVQKDPHEGESATESTEVKIVYTNRSIFFGVSCHDTSPGAILATELRRDQELENDDSISIILDTFHDHRSAFLFRTNPLATQFDALVTDEGRIINTNWDEKWNVAARRGEEGWTVEMEIPFKTLRVMEQEDQLWGIDFERVIRRKNEFTYWTNYRRDFKFEQVSQAGHLRGLENLEAGLTWRIKPFMRTSLAHASGNRIGSDLDSLSDVGLEDLKYRLTSSFTADFTANTDFAETDVDEQVINLTRFPVFFPEKREFFLEGAGIFDYGPGGGPTSELKLFFSRRIGLSPEGETIPILGGAKLTGKAKGWTLGLMDMQSDQFKGIPRRNFGVFRVKRDLFARSNVGAIFTNRQSRAPGDPYNRALGLDANFILFDHFNVQTFATGTYSPGQDRDQWAGRVRSFWESDLLFANLEHLVIQRNFNPEMGWLPRRDMQRTKAQFDFKPRPASRIVRQLIFRTTLDYITNQAGQLQTRIQSITVEAPFQSADRFSVKYDHLFDRIRKGFALQGLVSVPTGEYDWNSILVQYTSAPQRKLSGAAAFRREPGFYGGTNTQVNVRPFLKVSENLSLAPSYQFNQVRLPRGQFKSHLVNSQINYAFSRRWLTSATVQYNSTRSFAGVNFRLNYIYRPGDDFFLVYNEFRTLSQGSMPGEVHRALIAKVTYSFDF